MRRPFAVEVVGERRCSSATPRAPCTPSTTAARTAAFRSARQGAVPRHGHLRLPRLDLRPRDGELVAVITDGPDSPICGKVTRARPTRPPKRLGLVWVFVGDGETAPARPTSSPRSWSTMPDMAVGGRIEDRDGNWRFDAENGFDEGHAKYLHRTALWRIFKAMPTWNKIHVERARPVDLPRRRTSVTGTPTSPGSGTGPASAGGSRKPPKSTTGNARQHGRAPAARPVHRRAGLPGLRLGLDCPGVLRIAYPPFIHYEFYVPIDAERTQVRRRHGGRSSSARSRAAFFARTSVRSAGCSTASSRPGPLDGRRRPMRRPSGLYRPDVSLLEWRRLVEDGSPFDRADPPSARPSP